MHYLYLVTIPKETEQSELEELIRERLGPYDVENHEETPHQEICDCIKSRRTQWIGERIRHHYFSKEANAIIRESSAQNFAPQCEAVPGVDYTRVPGQNVDEDPAYEGCGGTGLIWKKGKGLYDWYSIGGRWAYTTLIEQGRKIIRGELREEGKEQIKWAYLNMMTMWAIDPDFKNPVYEEAVTSTWQDVIEKTQRLSPEEAKEFKAYGLITETGFINARMPDSYFEDPDWETRLDQALDSLGDDQQLVIVDFHD